VERLPEDLTTSLVNATVLTMQNFRVMKHGYARGFPLLDLPTNRVGGGVAIESLPFAVGDATAGTENELQAIVIGKRNIVDLPVSIERSKYYANVARRVACDEAPRDLIRELEEFLAGNQDRTWDNSWVRFPRNSLSAFANQLFDQDLAGRKDSGGVARSDRDKFVFAGSWGDWLRVPISYLVKLALADVVGRQPNLPRFLQLTALRLLPHFSNDNTSPETFSFYVVDSKRARGFGRTVAAEMSVRFLLTHLLVEWANKTINLESVGQRAAINFAPHPAVRQRELNNCVSDAFYRELFVSPCLSGWSDGESKHEYMLRAHQVTSRSQINAVAKLREAGIITNNLVVLPNTSSVSLANNGTHLSLGSKVLAQHLSDPHSGFTAPDEKLLGDLVIKICEHFLPLFVGTYTAAPYRLGFSDFHPEQALGFLPHELDYTHLRMLWRHWKRKAQLRVCGRVITPYGPKWLDNFLAGAFALRGDLVTDYRLIDFPVAWLCTESASALDGQVGNTERLKLDLESMGVSDRYLKLYLPVSLREFETMGFSGFEGRHYSLFASMAGDFAPAADLQRLITVLAYKYALSGEYAHLDIPHEPSSESERRLPFFCAALGLPAFNIRVNTPNDFLRRIVALTANTSASRHGGYLRVPLREYCVALVQLLQEDAADCIEMLGLQSLLADISERLREREHRTYSKLLDGILGKVGKNDAFKLEAREFNLLAEQFYREDLKRELLKESLTFVRESLERFKETDRESLQSILPDLRPSHFLNEIEHLLASDQLTPKQLSGLISLVLLVVKWESGELDGPFTADCKHIYAESPVHRSPYAASA
jgi:hypothetical protein